MQFEVEDSLAVEVTLQQRQQKHLQMESESESPLSDTGLTRVVMHWLRPGQEWLRTLQVMGYRTPFGVKVMTDAHTSGNFPVRYMVCPKSINVEFVPGGK